MGRGREVGRYPGGLSRSHEPNQAPLTPESSHSPWVARPWAERRARDFTKLYLPDTGEKTPAHTLRSRAIPPDVEEGVQDGWTEQRAVQGGANSVRGLPPRSPRHVCDRIGRRGAVGGPHRQLAVQGVRARRRLASHRLA